MPLYPLRDSGVRSFASPRVPVILTILALLAACNDQFATGPHRLPGALSRDLGTAPSVEFFVHAAPEDWQLFMGNVTIASLQRGVKVVMVHATAGDAGQAAAFWQRRENAALTSVDAVIGPGAWTCVAQSVSAHPIQRCSKANAVVYFMRMPDGNNFDGTGFGFGSLSTLRDRGTPTQTIDGSTTYTAWSDFTATFRAILDLESQGVSASAIEIHSPDFDRTINPGDHPDNAATADAARAATLGNDWTLAWYIDNHSKDLPVNLSASDHDVKQRVFLAYDSVMVGAGYSSDADNADIQQWLWRTYSRIASPLPPTAPTGLEAQATAKWRVDLQWSDNSSNETGFYVDRAPDNAGVAGTYLQIATVEANATTYGDVSVIPSTTYWYRVRAYSDGGNSAFSNSVRATTPASTPLPYRGDAYIVAHEDDWQIFMSDRTYTSFQSAASMLFIYATAGDAGNGPTYWQARERGALASMDTMSGASGSWTCVTRAIRAHPIWRCAKFNVVSYFMRMPDGNNTDGTGYGYGSLSTLRDRGTPTSALDGSTTYTSWSDFYSTLGAIVDLEFDNQSSPYVQVNTQEFDRTLDPSDHADHNATGDATRGASATRSWGVTWYVGYDTKNRPINLTTAQHSEKVPPFYACNATMAAAGYPSDFNDPTYQAWLWRTYFRQSTTGASLPPAAPTNLLGQAVSESEIDLTWTDNSTTESSLTLQRAADNSGVPGTYSTIATLAANAVRYSNTGLTTNTKYWYRLRANNSDGSSAWVVTSAITLATPPTPPSNMVAGATTNATTVTLSWKDNSADETGFLVEQAPDNGAGPGTYVQIATVPANVRTYTPTGLTGAKKYWYRVRAYSSYGNSSYSNQASVTTPLPRNLTVSSTTISGSLAAKLSWTPGVGAQVDVYRDGARIKSGITNTGSATDTNRRVGVTNVYKICNPGQNNTANCSNSFSKTF
jgi:hypothetical protein